MYIIEKLKIIRQGLCGYSGNFCDCKYGIGDLIGGEKTGCPEIRDAITLLEQSYELLKRAKHSVESFKLAYEIEILLEQFEKEH